MEKDLLPYVIAGHAHAVSNGRRRIKDEYYSKCYTYTEEKEKG